MDPQLMQMMLGLGQQNDPEQLDLMRRQKMVDAMRGNAMVGSPPTVQAGRMHIPNYGGAISNAMQAHMASREQPQLDQRQKQLNARQMDARSRYLDALTMALRRPTPGSNQPMMPPDGMEDR